MFELREFCQAFLPFSSADMRPNERSRNRRRVFESSVQTLATLRVPSARGGPARLLQRCPELLALALLPRHGTGARRAAHRVPAGTAARARHPRPAAHHRPGQRTQQGSAPMEAAHRGTGTGGRTGNFPNVDFVGGRARFGGRRGGRPRQSALLSGPAPASGLIPQRVQGWARPTRGRYGTA